MTTDLKMLQDLRDAMAWGEDGDTLTDPVVDQIVSALISCHLEMPRQAIECLQRAMDELKSKL